MVDLLTEFMELGKLLGTGYSADEVDDILSGLDEVSITDFEEFQGGYALSDEEIAEVESKIQSNSSSKTKERMHEVILALIDSDYKRYNNNIGIIQKGTELSSTDALYTAVLDIANDIRKGNGNRPSLFNKLFGK